MRAIQRNSLHFFFSLFYLSAALCSCGRRQLIIRIDIVPGSNANSAIAVDIVRVTDSDLSKQMSKLSAAEWFGGKKDEFSLTYSKPGVLSVVDSSEWIAGQTGIGKINLPAPKLVKIPHLSAPAPTVFVFANYSTPGPHRAVLQPDKITTIQLGVEDLKVIVDKK